eukprot:6920572-Lingulodinium_polyedra.AAC.1
MTARPWNSNWNLRSHSAAASSAVEITAPSASRSTGDVRGGRAFLPPPKVRTSCQSGTVIPVSKALVTSAARATSHPCLSLRSRPAASLAATRRACHASAVRRCAHASSRSPAMIRPTSCR